MSTKDLFFWNPFWQQHNGMGLRVSSCYSHMSHQYPFMGTNKIILKTFHAHLDVGALDSGIALSFVNLGHYFGSPLNCPSLLASCQLFWFQTSSDELVSHIVQANCLQFKTRVGIEVIPPKTRHQFSFSCKKKQSFQWNIIKTRFLQGSNLIMHVMLPTWLQRGWCINVYPAKKNNSYSNGTCPPWN